MFLDFYHLREQPFGVTPDPRYLYLGPGHREALASLFYGIETGRGFLSLIAEPGMGKTTLLFQLLQRWKDTIHTAFVFHTQCDSRELLRYVLADFGLQDEREDIVRMQSVLHEFLIREATANKRVVLFIDEAQNLSDTVLETLRLLSDFEAPDKKLLQIVLAGQPELGVRLSRPGMAQLNQRIAIRARLDPLPASEIPHYINHRLQVAGCDRSDLFTRDAVSLVAERSRGIPRLINNLCFSALSLGCAMRRPVIGADIVREAAADLSLAPPVANPPDVDVPSTPDVTPARQPLFTSPHSWAEDHAFERRLLQASVLAVAVGLMASHVAHRWTDRTPAPVVRSSLAQPAADESVGVQPDESEPPSGRDQSQGSFTYVVRRKDTIDHLCRSALGECDVSVLASIRKLNPDLRNLNHIEVGQTIRLPRSQQ